MAAARRQEQRLQLRRPSRSARGCRWGRGALALLLALGCALLDSLTQSELHAPEHAANGHLRRGHLFAEAFGLGNLLDFGGSAGLRKEPLWSINHSDGSVALASDLNADEEEHARTIVVRMLAALYERDLLPYRTRNYARRKGVLDRVPLEKFMALASDHLRALGELDNCLEWGPFFTRWPNVTQPYMRKFRCKTQWTFNHDTKAPRVRTILGNTVYGGLDQNITSQGLDSVKNTFDLVIIPQTLQYVTDPHLSARVLFDLVKPGGFLVFSSPFLQTVMPYPADYYRFTAEGNELVLKQAGFQVLKSYVGGDEFWSLCWIMHCGVSDLPASMLGRALRETGKDYSQTAYMLSAQLARKPVATAL